MGLGKGRGWAGGALSCWGQQGDVVVLGVMRVGVGRCRELNGAMGWMGREWVMGVEEVVV